MRARPSSAVMPPDPAPHSLARGRSRAFFLYLWLLVRRVILLGRVIIGLRRVGLGRTGWQWLEGWRGGWHLFLLLLLGKHLHDHFQIGDDFLGLVRVERGRSSSWLWILGHILRIRGGVWRDGDGDVVLVPDSRPAGRALQRHGRESGVDARANYPASHARLAVHAPILYIYLMRRIAGGRWIGIWVWLWRIRRRLLVCWRRIRRRRLVCWRRIRRRRLVCWRRRLVCWRRRRIRGRRGIRWRGLISRRGRGPCRRRIVRRGRRHGGLLPLPDVGRREVLPPGHVGFGQGLRRARGAAREVDVHAYPLAGAVRHRQRRFRPCFGLNRLRNVAGSSPSI